MEDDLFINAHMVEQGYAQVMTIPPNVKFASLFLELQREARAAERGLWAE
jgi:micrococcal nuclease